MAGRSCRSRCSSRESRTCRRICLFLGRGTVRSWVICGRSNRLPPMYRYRGLLFPVRQRWLKRISNTVIMMPMLISWFCLSLVITLGFPYNILYLSSAIAKDCGWVSFLTEYQVCLEIQAFPKIVRNFRKSSEKI